MAKSKFKLSRVIVPHSPKCFMKNKENPWSGLTDGAFIGNFAANPKANVGRFHFWHKATCNDPKCPAIKAVHSSVIRNA